jgi:hypothetical protein
LLAEEEDGKWSNYLQMIFVEREKGIKSDSPNVPFPFSSLAPLVFLLAVFKWRLGLGRSAPPARTVFNKAITKEGKEGLEWFTLLLDFLRSSDEAEGLLLPPLILLASLQPVSVSVLQPLKLLRVVGIPSLSAVQKEESVSQCFSRLSGSILFPSLFSHLSSHSTTPLILKRRLVCAVQGIHVILVSILVLARFEPSFFFFDCHMRL